MRPAALYLATLLSLVSGFTLPEGLSDGVYMASYGPNGNEIHTLINSTVDKPFFAGTAELPSEADEVTTAGHGRHHRTQQRAVETWCGCGWVMDYRNCDTAVEDLKAQFDHDGRTLPGSAERPVTLRPHTSYYAVRGNVVAFACNENPSVAVTSRLQMTAIAQAITRSCGWYVAGTGEYGREGNVEYPLMGYMKHSAGLNFCRMAKSSPAHHC
ncbi:hypothetical protein K461DRAFT_323512 [Myriangium duriaei CBS 260.36]|uniref:Uncharacterized protein n=1 Tax=Myriangium duriaei CBS 260.36 TaxID=1168546 RepID=A0A9P4IWZ9_9PEZI|nr:hypothetical protein K461DRAFT_323512 [Myriangium duriaei CBS 260.36]